MTEKKTQLQKMKQKKMNPLIVMLYISVVVIFVLVRQQI